MSKRSYVRIPNGCDRGIRTRSRWLPPIVRGPILSLDNDHETFLDQQERLTSEGIISHLCEDEPEPPE